MHPPHRDKDLEGALQEALDGGYSVWAVGDIHGYREEFEDLLGILRLVDGDMVICLGDLIDRGPDSHGVLSIVSESNSIFSIKGNHELLMSEALTAKSDRMTTFWEDRIGGRETLFSMPGDADDEKRERATKWLEFTDSLPTEVVLARFRLAHSGYKIDIPLREQTDEDRLKSREIFLAKRPLDTQRQIVAGHTPVQKLDVFGAQAPEEGIWFSPVKMEDGRPAATLIDTGIALKESELRPRLSAFDLQTGRIEEVERLDL
ncbi:MAG TPA: metallophosphoesterase [Candidatus Thalassarchaeaceae archaeon]|jgi:serine/threonine protein phosphatase 1|nr:metallophosphoesterase [Candidatus Thalassarchaeaceae archaeon]|tara:strand:- start:731 stop:1513 length:783 start_codon:yes stop_codon:yes gene_type:complete